MQDEGRRRSAEPIFFLFGIERLLAQFDRSASRFDTGLVLLYGELCIADFDANLVFLLLQTHLRLAVFQLSSYLIGLRFALGSMWLTLIAAETLAADSGIGYMTTTAREFLQTDRILVGVLLYAALGIAADQITRLLERTLLRWQPRFLAANGGRR